jgi:prepilin-type N-terminal cleavage/methylation domain-containing protein
MTLPSIIRRLLARIAAGQEGFTLIEVLASSVVVTVFMLGALGGIDAATHSSGSNRVHIDAQALAQEYSNQLRGLSPDELSGLSKTLTATLDGTTFTVAESATYVNNGSQTSVDCSHPTGDYIKTQVSVTWPTMGSRAPVVVQSFVTPSVGGGSAKGVLYSVVTAAGNPVSGATVTAAGPATYTGTTDTNGCVIWGGATPGTYTLTVSGLTGNYVDLQTGAVVNSTNPPTGSATVTAGASAGYSFNEQAGGSLAVSFTSTVGATNYASGTVNPGTAGAIGVVVQNNSMMSNYLRVCTVNDSACPKVNTVDTNFPYANWTAALPKSYVGTQTLTALYPFNASSNPTGNYAVWAGVCSANEPAQNGATDVTATVASGQTSTATVTLPSLAIQTSTTTTTGNGNNKTTTTTYALPAHLYIKDTGCNVRYYGYKSGTIPAVAGTQAGLSPAQATIPMSASYTGGAGGILQFPGLPYGTYNVCVDNGTNYVEKTIALTSNQTWSIDMGSLTGTPLSSETGTGSGQC